MKLIILLFIPLISGMNIKSDMPPPPSPSETAKLARYVLHYSGKLTLLVNVIKTALEPLIEVKIIEIKLSS